LACRSGPCDILCARTTVFSSATKSQAYPLASLVIRRGFGCVALSFAQRKLLVLPSLFFLGPCACCPLSFSPVSTVIWLECHWILLCGGLISYLTTIYGHVFEFCLSLLFARRGLFPKTTLKSDELSSVTDACSKPSPRNARLCLRGLPVSHAKDPPSRVIQNDRNHHGKTSR
jgi:hypothetical protein